MDFLSLFSVLLFLLRPALGDHRQGIGSTGAVPPSSLRAPSERGLLRSRRSTPHKITECVFATSEEGSYYYEAEENSEEVCGVYLFADPGQVVRVELEALDVPCESGGLVTFFDGWELNGKYFPGAEDHEKPFRERHAEFCGSETPGKTFLTSQNAGMLHYRVPLEGGGFRFRVRFFENPAPCNVLVESAEQFYTLRNHGKAGNCTLVAVFPARIRVLALQVGVPTPSRETGTVSQCGEKISDGVLVGGSRDLDSSRLVSFRDFCGLDSSPGSAVVIRCEVSVVRLVSSGLHDNSVTVGVAQPRDVDFFEPAFAC